MPEIEQLRSALSGTYAVERLLGSGGMATVYLARDLRHDRPVAVKVLDPELGAILGAERFLAEIRVTANLQHPNLLPLFDSGDADGQLYYVMPYVEGETLRHRLERERQLPVDEAVRIAAAIADALAYAHARGVVHRDLKPENILLQHGQPVVADFGIALAVSKAGGQRITQTGLSLGTPQYMSPEQATGDRVIDGRSDLYSLAAVLYEMLSGDPPHTGSTSQAVIAKVLTEQPRSVRTTRQTVPVHVSDAVDRALAKLPADRFDSATHFAEALRAAPPPRSSDGAVTMRAGWSRSVRAWQAIATVALLALGAVAVLGRSGSGEHESLQLARQITFDGRVIGAAISPDGAWLAYVTDDCMHRPVTCTSTLHVREVDGTQSVRVASWPRIETRVRWSPDGSTLLFSGTPADGTTGTYLTSRLGGSIRRVSVTPTAITFSRDGRSILAATGADGRQALSSIDLESLSVASTSALPIGLTVVELDQSPEGALAALLMDSLRSPLIGVLSPDGELLDSVGVAARPLVRWDPLGEGVIFAQVGPGTADDLVRIPVRRNRLRAGEAHVWLGQVPTSYAGEFDVSRSGRVALVTSPTSHELLRLRLDAAGDEWAPITDRTGFLSATDISPDGSSVVADATDNLGDNIYTFPMDGGEPRAITAVRGTRGGARWSPEGRRLAYLRITSEGVGIIVSDAAGGSERLIARSGSFAGWVGGNAIALVNTGGFAILDTTGTMLRRIEVPDSLAPYRGGGSFITRPSPAGGKIAYWSGAAGGVVEVDVGTQQFRVRSRTAPRAEPVGWGANGNMFLWERLIDGGSETGTPRLMKLPEGSDSRMPSTVLPRNCRSVVVGGGGRRAICTVVHARPDVWIADHPGRSRW